MSRSSGGKRAGAKNTGRAVVALGIAAVAAKLSVVGCDDTGSYIFTGEQYDPVLQCLEPVSSIDVIAGNEPGSCAPACILSLPQDGGQIAYVSTLCGPYPMYPFESDASTSPLCVAALNAFARDALCEDGGVVLPPDSGTDATPASDASPDAAAAADASVPPSDAGAATDASQVASDAGPDGAADATNATDAASD